MHLNISLEQLVTIIGGEVKHTSPLSEIARCASLEGATAHDVAFVFDRGDKSIFGAVALDKIKKSQAGTIIAAQALVDDKNFIIHQDPLAAYQKIVAHMQQEKMMRYQGLTPDIKPTASIASSAVIKAGSVIGDFSVVMDQVYVGYDVKIGSQVLIYPGVKILDGSIIGDGSIIHPGAVIGSDGFGYQVTQQGMRKIPHIGIVRIGRQVELGANCTIDRAVFDETVVGDGAKFDNGVHLAHNVKVGMGTAIIAHTVVGGSVTIGRGCQIGAQVAIRDNITIGDGAQIVSKSGIMHPVAPKEIVAGIPAVSFGLWKRNAVLLTKLPELFQQAQKISEHMKKRSSSFFARFFGRS